MSFAKRVSHQNQKGVRAGGQEEPPGPSVQALYTFYSKYSGACQPLVQNWVGRQGSHLVCVDDPRWRGVVSERLTAVPTVWILMSNGSVQRYTTAARVWEVLFSTGCIASPLQARSAANNDPDSHPHHRPPTTRHQNLNPPLSHAPHPHHTHPHPPQPSENQEGYDSDEVPSSTPSTVPVIGSAPKRTVLRPASSPATLSAPPAAATASVRSAGNGFSPFQAVMMDSAQDEGRGNRPEKFEEQDDIVTPDMISGDPQSSSNMPKGRKSNQESIMSSASKMKEEYEQHLNTTLTARTGGNREQ